MGTYVTRAGGSEMGGRGSSSGKSVSSAKNSVSSLPKLEGTEKQVQWADSIRQNYVSSVRNFLDSDDLEFKDNFTSAAEVMNDIFENGVTGYYNSFAKKLHEDIKKQNPNLSVAQRDDKFYDFVSKIHAEASAAYKELKAIDKAKAKIAKSAVYKRYAKQFLDYSLSNAKSASSWIDLYKNTKYAK